MIQFRPFTQGKTSSKSEINNRKVAYKKKQKNRWLENLRNESGMNCLNFVGLFLTSGIFYFPKGSGPTFPVTRSRNEVKPNGWSRWTVKGSKDYKVFQVHLSVWKFTGVLADSSKSSSSSSAAAPLTTESTSDRHCCLKGQVVSLQ